MSFHTKLKREKNARNVHRPSNISHVIACANESIYGHEFRNISFQPSSVHHSTPMNV
jgi:hypothetical protein